MLEVTVFLGGALVMVLEMVGARVLAPHVGTSAVVWTSLIGVVLACLALGAWAGGRYADKSLSRAGLGRILLGAGLGCALTACFNGVAGSIAQGLGNIYLAAVAAALAVFALPALFCGMLSPYVIRLRIASVDTAGATVGRLYALSTAGSILGTFLGGFVLISFWGSQTILWGVSLAFLVLSLVNDRQRPLLRLLLLVGCLLLAVLGNQREGWLAENSGQRLVESPYNSIRISEGVDRNKADRPVRLMATDPGYSQSGMLLDAPEELYFHYTRFYALGPRFVPGADSVLMLGGGGYSVPKWLFSDKSGLAGQGLEVCVVELDPAMTDTARRWFGLADREGLEIRHEDARAFLNRQQRQFDLVFVDVFNSHYSVPFQMGTLEAAAGLRRAVAPGGALLMNVISAVEGEDGRLFRSIWHALAAHFAEVRVFCVSRPDRPDMVQNLMLLALPEAGRPVRPAARAADATADPPAAEVDAMLACQYAQPIAQDVPPLSDDFAPVERYAMMLLRQ